MINTQKVTRYSTISQTPGNIVSDMDGEKVMLNIEEGKYDKSWCTWWSDLGID